MMATTTLKVGTMLTRAQAEALVGKETVAFLLDTTFKVSAPEGHDENIWSARPGQLVVGVKYDSADSKNRELQVLKVPSNKPHFIENVIRVCNDKGSWRSKSFAPIYKLKLASN
jgi:hypothetical protein